MELNVTGLRKLLRKFDKYSHQQVGSSLLIAFNPEIQALCDTHALDVIACAIEVTSLQCFGIPALANSAYSVCYRMVLFKPAAVAAI